MSKTISSREKLAGEFGGLDPPWERGDPTENALKSWGSGFDLLWIDVSG